MPTIPPDLALLLRRWSSVLGSAADVRLLNEQGSVLGVRAEDGARYVLKAVDGSVFPEHASERLDLLRYLKVQGVPVAAPLPLDGTPEVFKAGMGGRQYWLSPDLAGAAPPGAAPGPRWYGSTGAAIARLHRALASYPGPLHSWRLDLAGDTLRRDIPLLRERLAEADRASFERAAGYLAQRLPGRLAGLPAHHIHGDCHGGNVLWDGDAVAGFIDLDHLPWGPRVYDLGYFLADLAKNRFRRPEEIARWFAGLRPFLEGYRAELGLSESEVTILPAVMLAVQVRFAAWFAQHDDPRAQLNLDALYWLDGQAGRIMGEMG
jgi:Ser/Thr protein kinase RdoA (MazF antagonist)